MAFGRMKHEDDSSHDVLVGVNEMAMRLRETTSAIAGALELLTDQGRAEETSMGGRWRLCLTAHCGRPIWHEGVKRVLVWIAIEFGRQGKQKRISIHRTEYFTTYEDDSRVSDMKRLMAIRASGLEQKLNSVALERAARGFWTDFPHPKPRPFVGGAKVEFFDDEKRPTPEAPLYCAGKSCLPNL